MQENIIKLRGSKRKKKKVPKWDRGPIWKKRGSVREEEGMREKHGLKMSKTLCVCVCLQIHA